MSEHIAGPPDVALPAHGNPVRELIEVRDALATKPAAACAAPRRTAKDLAALVGNFAWLSAHP